MPRRGTPIKLAKESVPLLTPKDFEEKPKSKVISAAGVRNVLKTSGVIRSSSGEEDFDMNALLDEAGLTPREILTEVGSLMRCGDSSPVRLRAAETGLKLNGMLQNDEGPKVPFQVNIVINDGHHKGVNPILVPR